MAYHDMNRMMTTGEMILALVALPFQKLGAALSRLGHRTARGRWLAQVNAMSDADLARRGLTRAEAVQLMLRAQV